MKLFVQQNIGGTEDGKWNWTLETDGGTVIAASVRYYENKIDCVKEVRSVQSSFGMKSIVVKQQMQSLV